MPLLLPTSVYSAKARTDACDQNTRESLKARKRGVFLRQTASILAKIRIAPIPAMLWKPRFTVVGNVTAKTGMEIATKDSEKGVTSQNVTVQPDFDLQCQTTDDQSTR